MNVPDRTQFRDLRHYLAAVASELAAPVLRAYARRRVPTAPTPPSAWRRGVIVGHGHIGDVLYRTCSLEALARGLPNCEWSYLTTPFAAEVLVGNPAVAHILPYMRSWKVDDISAADMARLRATSYDVILSSENVRHQDGLRLALTLGIPNRVAFVQKGLSGLVTHPVRLPHPMSRPAQFRAMVESVTGASIERELRPRVFCTPEDMAEADAEWQRLQLGDALVVACAMTTRQTTGAAAPDAFVRVLKQVLPEHPHVDHSPVRVLLLGSTADADILYAAATALGPEAVVSEGRVGLRAVVALLSRCRVFWGMDSGPRHLANAAGIPVAFVRNMATSAIEAGAYCATEWDAVSHYDDIARYISTYLR